jgi:hypothetical protein
MASGKVLSAGAAEQGAIHLGISRLPGGGAGEPYDRRKIGGLAFACAARLKRRI